MGAQSPGAAVPLKDAMHTLFAPRSPRWFAAAGIAVTALSLMFVLPGSPPARAHDALVQSSPAADSVVSATPAEVSMTYSGEVFDASSAIAVEVIDSSGANVALTPPVVADTTVTQAVKPVTSPGVVTVRWRVVSSDGHPISGEYAFTVDAPVTPTASAEPDPSATTGAPSSSEQSPAISSTPEQSATADAVAEVEEPRSGIGLPLLVTGVAVVILGAAALVLFSSGRRRRQQQVGQ
ncbi:hypothetical protein B0I12_003475 [Microbacterium hydrothermale]|nr:hypothetical protein [Microbacterium hydrothermale]